MTSEHKSAGQQAREALEAIRQRQERGSVLVSCKPAGNFDGVIWVNAIYADGGEK